MTYDFKIVGKLNEITIIARDRQIRELAILQKRFGRGRWRKLKGIADVVKVTARSD